MEALDGLLWTYRDESFLPHGAAGDAERQPVWLTEGEHLPNDPQILFLVDGACADPDAIGGLERCVVIFNGNDEEALADARGFWKASKDKGHDVTYWKQSAEGRWEKQT